MISHVFYVLADFGGMVHMKVRDRGIAIGRLPIGEKNCITDVQGVRVGHVTLQYPIGTDREM